MKHPNSRGEYHVHPNGECMHINKWKQRPNGRRFIVSVLTRQPKNNILGRKVIIEEPPTGWQSGGPLTPRRAAQAPGILHLAGF